MAFYGLRVESDDEMNRDMIMSMNESAEETLKILLVQFCLAYDESRQLI